MHKIGEGPNSLQKSLEADLKADAPAWDSIQPKTKEYARLAGEAGKYDPPKGDKDSWAKLTAALFDSASDLDTAAQAKDTDGTRAARSSLSNSGMACHRQHRNMGPPGGGFGPPGGFGGGRPPSGPPSGEGGPPPGPPPGGPPPA
jgi:hypothetical protein